MANRDKNEIVIYQQYPIWTELVAFALNAIDEFEVVCVSDWRQFTQKMEDPSRVAWVITDTEIWQSCPFDFLSDKNSSVRVALVTPDIKAIKPDAQVVTPTYVLHQPTLFASLEKWAKEYYGIEWSERVIEHPPIRLQLIKSIDVVQMDLWIQLLTGRMLKLFDVQYKATAPDFKKYESNGMDHLYMHRSQWMITRANLAGQLERLVSQPDARISMALPNLKSAAQPVEGGPLMIPVTPAELSGPFALERTALDEVTAAYNEQLNHLLANSETRPYFESLAVPQAKLVKQRLCATANAVGALAKLLQWEGAVPYQKLFYAILLKDIKLFSSPELFNLISGEQPQDPQLAERYQLHPEEAAGLATNDPHAPPDISAIILQHHELPDRRGFPQKLTSTRVLPFAILLHIATDLVMHMQQHADFNMENYLQARQAHFSGGIFCKVFALLPRLELSK